MNYYTLVLWQLLFGICTSNYISPQNDRTTIYDDRNAVNRNWDTNKIEVGEKSKLKLKVYYETLCPASISFFTSQLKPVVEKLSSHVDVILVPYGHASTRSFLGRYIFNCQHGQAECYGNMIHACTLDALQNNTQAVLFNVCLMQFAVNDNHYRYDYNAILHWCSYKQNLLITEIWRCLYTDRSSHLLKRHGEDTQALQPRFVPYVTLDGAIDNQNDLSENLMSTICGKLQPAPPPCINQL